MGMCVAGGDVPSVDVPTTFDERRLGIIFGGPALVQAAIGQKTLPNLGAQRCTRKSAARDSAVRVTILPHAHSRRWSTKSGAKVSPFMSLEIARSLIPAMTLRIFQAIPQARRHAGNMPASWTQRIRRISRGNTGNVFAGGGGYALHRRMGRGDCRQSEKPRADMATRLGPESIEFGGVNLYRVRAKKPRGLLDCNQNRVPLIFHDVNGLMVGRAEWSGIIRAAEDGKTP